MLKQIISRQKKKGHVSCTKPTQTHCILFIHTFKALTCMNIEVLTKTHTVLMKLELHCLDLMFSNTLQAL